LSALAPESFGPFSIVAAPHRVRDFVVATGDDPERWTDHAPPGFAAVALIAVASALFERAMTRYAAVVHTRQRFDWEGPLEVGRTLEVTGEIISARDRSGTTLVEFAAAAPGWMTSTSHFLMAETSAAELAELVEPSPDARAHSEVPTPQRVPEVGEALPVLAKSASRSDILRYAAASGDWNPIHWDHQTAVAAGLGGVIAHGLLSASWIAQAAARFSARPDPLGYLDLRFRSPLRPNVPAIVGGTVASVAPLALDQAITVAGDVAVSARAQVNE